jgi:16S rRNA C1402 (ribose-2'-O) methylase RsmI
MGPSFVVVARELTKKFETFHRGILGQELTPPFIKKGECIVIVEGRLENHNNSDDEIIEYIKETFKDGYKTKDIVKELIIKFNITKNHAYDLALKSSS